MVLDDVLVNFDGQRAYAAADVLILPTFYEPCANVVLEAMAAGVPVVASRVEGVPEAIEHGRNGLLVQPGDAMI